MATRIKKTDLARDALYDKVNVMIDEVNTKIDNKDSLPSQTGKAGKFLTTDGTNASWGEVKQIKIAQNLTNPSADTVPSTKAVKDESSRITTLMNTKVSNCITYIPQDIKLELNNGTLTLKAGSKVYVPNGKNADGSNKFDEVTVASDKTASYGHGGSDLVWYRGNRIDLLPINFVFSGSTAPSGNQYMLWYDTTNNQIKYTNNSGASWSAEQSFALGVIATSSSAPTSIDQVFNGFGYIGNTVFALPGVKGLIPNGRNADGSLKNIEYTLDKVSITTNGGSTDTRNIMLYSNGNIDHPELSGYLYDENFFWSMNYNGSGYFKGDRMCIGPVEYSSGKVTSFTPKTVFHALDYNDKSTISSWSMPSSRYIDLSLGASGATYTAPANGWIHLVIDINANGFLSIDDNYFQGSGINSYVGGKVPMRKGQTFYINYNGYIRTIIFRFIYAEGEN